MRHRYMSGTPGGDNGIAPAGLFTAAALDPDLERKVDRAIHARFRCSCCGFTTTARDATALRQAAWVHHLQAHDDETAIGGQFLVVSPEVAR